MLSLNNKIADTMDLFGFEPPKVTPASTKNLTEAVSLMPSSACIAFWANAGNVSVATRSALFRVSDAWMLHTAS